MTSEEREALEKHSIIVAQQLYNAIDQKISTAFGSQELQMQDLRRLAAAQVAPKNVIALETDYPVAYESNDHLAPWGTKNDNTRSQRFCRAVEAHFGRKVMALDLGCSGGGLVYDFLIRGNVAFGLEGSDHSLKAQRAEWSVIPDYLRTCDIAKPFLLRDQRTGNRAKFDVISMWEVVEHIPEALLPQLFANVRDHLAEGGLFVGSAATYDDVHDGVSYHPTVKPQMWWRTFAQSQGLTFVPSAMFAFKDFCRGSGNPHTWADPDFSKDPAMGFHFVMQHAAA